LAATPESWIASAAVRERLALVERYLVDRLAALDPSVAEVTTYLLRGKGKRLRPALLLSCAAFGSLNRAEVTALAAAVEWFHTATLYHDDIMDSACARRYQASANQQWGNRTATFAGNYLYARAAQVFADCGDPVNRIFSQAVCEVWRGQMLEMAGTFDVEVAASHYLQAIEKKTAALCELPCHVGALLAQLPPASVEALRRFGRFIGLAFQLVDDLLDLFGDANQVGKPTATDLREGIYTLPVIYAVQGRDKLSRRIRARLRSVPLSEQVCQELIGWLRQHPATGRAVTQARHWIASARDLLCALPAGDCRQSLHNFADLVDQRIPEGLGQGERPLGPTGNGKGKRLPVADSGASGNGKAGLISGSARMGQGFAEVLRTCRGLGHPWLQDLGKLTLEDGLAAPTPGPLADVASGAAGTILDTEEFQGICEFLRHIPGGDLPLLARLLDRLWDPGGSRLRAALLHWTQEARLPSRTPLTPVAIAIELAQLTLQLHPAVLEAAGASPQTEAEGSLPAWSNRFILMLGDNWLATSYALIAEVDARLCLLTAEATAKVWQGKVLAQRHAHQLDWPVSRYLSCVGLTHATFCELPCRIGAVTSGAAPRPSKALVTFGFQLGMAWHLFGEAEAAAREVVNVRDHPLCHGLTNGLYPLSVRLAATGAGSRRLRALLGAGDVDAGTVRQVQHLLANVGAVERVRHLARQHLQRARAALARLPRGRAHECLLQLAKWIEPQPSPSVPPDMRAGGPGTVPPSFAETEISTP
jgi:heptaprenyl diphosphate synthase